MTGRLYGVGLGPGDPDLLTVKAARLIGEAKVVAYPAPRGGESFARSIAADYIAADATEIRMDVPMVTARAPAQEAYDAGAAAIAEHLSAGADVVALCEGDPLFYGSFMYLFARLAPRFEVEVVPGVSSLMASAAALSRPLVARDGVLTIIPGTLDDAALTARVEGAEAMAFVKVGRHLGRIRRVLTAAGLDGSAGYIERASLAAERILPLADAPDPAPYFSMVLAQRGGDPWLS